MGIRMLDGGIEGGVYWGRLELVFSGGIDEVIGLSLIRASEMGVGVRINWGIRERR